MNWIKSCPAGGERCQCREVRPRWAERGALRPTVVALPVLLLCLLLPAAFAESCLTANDMEAATRSALESTARRYFDMVQRGDAASLKQNAIPSVASNFGDIEEAVNDHKAEFTGAQGTLRPPYLLEAPGTAPLLRAEFFCGIYNSPDRVGFVIPNLPPGNYAIVIEDVTTSKGPYTVAFVLQQMANDWKLGGFYVKSGTIAGKDGNWFLQQARVFKDKGQLRNAFFYYWEARDLLAPVPFMGTPQLDKLYDESQQVAPRDLPVSGPVELAASGKTYKMTEMFPLAMGNDLDLVVKYQSADVSNTTQAFADNMAVIKGLVAKYPEFRDAFGAVVARAVEPSGRDYGSLLAMKDIK